MPDLLSCAEVAEKWGVTSRRVQTLCADNRIFGARKIGNTWMIPANAPKPTDARAVRYKEKETLPPDRELTSIDLFSGPGGLATGFKWAGIKPLIAVEWSYWTAQTYAKSHNAEILDLKQYEEDPGFLTSFLTKTDKPVLILGDINRVSNDLVRTLLKHRYGLDSVDIVTGGAPCESFSMAGERKEADKRNRLFENILRLSKATKAKIFIFENVKGLFSKKLDGRPGAMYEAICNEFEKETPNEPTYRLVSRSKEEVLLKAIDYGVPQARERLFLVGINQACSDAVFQYPKKTHGPNADYDYVSVSDAIGDLPKVNPGCEHTKYTYDFSAASPDTPQGLFLRRMRGDLSMPPQHICFEKDTLTSHKAPGHTEKMLGRIMLIKQGESMRTSSERLVKEGREDLVKAYYPAKIYGARNRRLKPNEPSFTVTSHCLDEMIHPTQNRGLTPREAARLQSFPDWYIFDGPHTAFHGDSAQDQYEQIGDAIPPLLAYALGKQVVSCLGGAQ